MVREICFHYIMVPEEGNHKWMASDASTSYHNYHLLIGSAEINGFGDRYPSLDGFRGWESMLFGSERKKSLRNFE